MKNKTFGVVGCGWLGMPMAKKWVEDNKVVHGTTTTEEKLKTIVDNGVQAHLLTTTNIEKNKHWLQKLDVLLLCIPPSRLKEKYGDFMLEIVKQLQSQGKIIFISSTSVYANNNQTATEEDQLGGKSRNAPYVIDAEKKLSTFAKDRLTVLRMSGLVGKCRHPVKYMQGREVSGGEEPVNLIHLEDCMGIIDHVIIHSIWGEIFNASAPKHPLKKDYYKFSAHQLNLEPPVFNGVPKKFKIIDSSKLTRQFNYSFKYLDPYIFPEIKIGDEYHFM